MKILCTAVWRFIRWPVLISLPLALCVGSLQVLPVLREQQYLHFHFYYTSAHLLVKSINRIAWPLALGLTLLFLAFHAGRRLPGRIVRIASILFPITLLSIPLAYFMIAVPAVRQAMVTHVQSDLRIEMRLLLSQSGLILLLLALLLYIAWKRGERSGLRMALHLARLRAICFRGFNIVVRVGLGLLALMFLLVNVLTGGLWIIRSQAASHHPNIIFIMIDTLRADHVGCYGYDLPTTPHIDRFAAESTRFEHAVSQASWTAWSVGSLMTSRHPDYLFSDRAASAGTDAIAPDLYYPTLSESLWEHGYTTQAVIANPMLHGSPENMQGYDRYDYSPAMKMFGQSTAPMVTNLGVQRLAQVKDRPFFLYLVYIDPHEPYFPHSEFTYGDSKHDEKIGRIITESNDPKKMQERQQALRNYNSEIGYTDHYVGEFLKALKQRGLYDDSLIVIFSDHGEEFLEHGGFSHRRTVYEEVTSVPLIIKFPRQREGRIVRGTFSLIDLYPSLLKMLDINASSLGLQGEAQNLTTLLKCADKPAYSATDHEPGLQCIRQGDMKYIRSPMNPDDGHPAGRKIVMRQKRIEEVYDLHADPWEQTNLLHQKQDIAVRFGKVMDEYNSRQRPRLLRENIRQEREGRNGSLTEQLKSLGYLQ